MGFHRVVAFVVVEEQDSPEIVEALLSVIDSFAVKNVPVFDSAVTASLQTEVHNAEEIRSEMTPFKI